MFDDEGLQKNIKARKRKWNGSGRGPAVCRRALRQGVPEKGALKIQGDKDIQEEMSWGNNADVY